MNNSTFKLFNVILIVCCAFLGGCGEQPDSTIEYDSHGLYHADFDATGNLVLVSTVSSVAELWDNAAGKKLHSWRFAQKSDLAANKTALAEDGKIAVTTSNDTIVVWNCQTGRAIANWQMPGIIQAIKISAAGKRALIAYNGSILQMIDLTNGNSLWKLLHRAYIESIDLAASGNIAVIGADDHTITVFDIENNKELQVFTEKAKVRFVAISPQNNFVVSSVPFQTIKIWDIKTGKLHQVLQTAPKFLSFAARPIINIVSANFSDNEQLLTIGTPPRNVYLWQVHSGKLLHNFSIPKKQLIKPTSAIVHAVALDSNSKTITAASSNGNGYTWHLE